MKPGPATATVVTVCLLGSVGCQQPRPMSPPPASTALAACNLSMKALDFTVSRGARLGLLAAAVNAAQVAAEHQPVTWDALLAAVRALQRAEVHLPQPVLPPTGTRLPSNGLIASPEQIRAYEQAVAGLQVGCTGVLHP